MPRITETGFHTFTQVKDLAVLVGVQQLKGSFRIGQSVQRFDLIPAGSLSFLVLPLGIAFLNVGGIPEHNGQELGREASGNDLAGKTLFCQKRETAGVVNVGVGDQNIVNIAGGEIQSVVVVLIPTLLQAAVDQDFFTPNFQTVAAARNSMGGAEKCEFHIGTSCLQFGRIDLIVHCFSRKFHSNLLIL